VTVVPDNIDIELGDLRLRGLLGVPEDAEGLVIFAHGSGSGRLSPRNNRVAAALRDAGLATLLLDLLTPDEERHRAIVFDIPLLASRLSFVADLSLAAPETAHLPIGYFGASTGAGAALVAAAARSPVRAIVSRGGRPDLAGVALPHVTAPTLLIVGSLDVEIIELNRTAHDRLTAAKEKELVIVPGAGHLFEEPGMLDAVQQHAIRWFRRHLAGAHLAPDRTAADRNS
jgi:putative phosphoribosyl transferase